MNNSLYTLCQECAFQYLFLPLALSGRALQFLEDEQFGGKQVKAKDFFLYSKKKIYLVEFSCLKYTDLSVVEGSIQASMKSAVQGTQETLALWEFLQCSISS